MEIASIIKKEFDYVKDSREEIIKKLTGKNSFVFAAKKNSVLAGFIFLRLRKGIAGIDGLAVKKNFRKKGLGSKLLKHALEFLKEKNFSAARLFVLASNKSAIKFYKKNGFVENKEKGRKIKGRKVMLLEFFLPRENEIIKGVS